MVRVRTIAAICLLSILAGCRSKSCDEVVHEAVAKANSHSKRLLIKFGSSWCEPCQRLEKFLNSKPVWSILGKHFDLLVIRYRENWAHSSQNVPEAEEWLARSGVKPTLPAMAILDEAGNVVASSSSGQSQKGPIILGAPPYAYADIPAFLGFIHSGAPDVTDDELWELRRILEGLIPAK